MFSATEAFSGFSVNDVDQDDKGIARHDDAPPIAWFTDPADNALAVLEKSA